MSDYKQMPISIMPQLCYPFKFSCFITLIMVTLLHLTNFAKIYNCFLKTLRDYI